MQIASVCLSSRAVPSRLNMQIGFGGSAPEALPSFTGTLSDSVWRILAGEGTLLLQICCVLPAYCHPRLKVSRHTHAFLVTSDDVTISRGRRAAVALNPGSFACKAVVVRVCLREVVSRRGPNRVWQRFASWTTNTQR